MKVSVYWQTGLLFTCSASPWRAPCSHMIINEPGKAGSGAVFCVSIYPDAVKNTMSSHSW